MTATAQAKFDEGATKLISTVGGWGPFNKLASAGKDKLQSATSFITNKKQLEAQGLGPAEVSSRLKTMGSNSLPAPVKLDALQSANQVASVEIGEITAAQLKEEIGARTQDDLFSHKVKLIERGVTEVIFDIMPEVVENRTVEYEQIAPPQHPTSFQKYKGTPSTQWTVQATLTCRNRDEATENLRILNTLRGWTMPFFGDKIKGSYPDKLGAPPPVLEFSGWRNQMVGPVQVVITSLNWNFPQDVDYIPANGSDFNVDANGKRKIVSSGELIPFPTVIKIAIQLVESFSTDQVNSFDLAAFRVGRFDKAFSQTVSGETSTGVAAGAAATTEEAQTVPGAGVAAAPTSTSSPAVSEAVEAAPATKPAAPAVLPVTGPPSTPPKELDEFSKRELTILSRAISQNQELLDRKQYEYDMLMKDIAFFGQGDAITPQERQQLQNEAQRLSAEIREIKSRLDNFNEKYRRISGSGGG